MKNKIKSAVSKMASIAALGLSLSAFAQTPSPIHRSEEFLNVLSVTVSNGINGLTNILSLGANGSNTVNTLLTNLEGYSVVTGQTLTNGVIDASQATSNLTYTFYPLIKDVALFPLKDGSPPTQWLTNGNGVAATTVPLSYVNLFIRLVGTNAAANSALNFRFVPLPDGTNETTAAGDVFVVGVTANGTTEVAVATNLNFIHFIGCKKIRLKDVTNVDTDAASSVVLKEVRLNTWMP